MLKAILIPAGVMLAIALLFGVLLVFLSQKFAVKRDEKVEEVEKRLAGSNCGGCGRAGCAAFAEELCAGTAKLSDCNSTSVEAKAEIAEILGVNAEKEEPTFAVVRCGGGNHCDNKYDYHGYGTCLSQITMDGGGKACEAGCMGTHSCVDVCAYYAIEVGMDGHACTDQSRCTSCGACIRECPKNLIVRIPKRAKVYVGCNSHLRGKAVSSVCSAGCIGCGLCAKVCPHGAITMDNNLPVIDYDKCTGCTACADRCPTKAIKKL